MKEKETTLSINVDVDTEILSVKLKAIAKHAQALADELDMIDATVCDRCGKSCEKSIIYADGEELYKNVHCPSCGEEERNDE